MAPSNDSNLQADLERIGSLGRQAPADSPLAQAAIARDLAQSADDAVSDSSGDDDESEEVRAGASNNGNIFGTTPHSLSGSYPRASYFTTGLRGGAIPHPVDQECIPWPTREQGLAEERDLLSDNNLIPVADGPIRSLQRRLSRTLRRTSSGRTAESQDDILADNGLSRKISKSSYRSNAGRPTEITALLPTMDSDNDSTDIEQKWEEAVRAGLIKTTWSREAQVIGTYWLPLMVTFLLQYSLTVASILAVGRLGKAELGAVSLAGMTAQITGYAIFMGLATSLDTLCAQAYGSGHLKLVGLQMQRMIFFLLLVTIPVAILWAFADRILLSIVPEKDVAILAGQYLKVIIFGLPGYALFESGKRYVQAQGLFTASLYVLLICAPLNAFLNWFLVWKLELGFIGAPIAVTISENLLPVFLFLYVYFFAGMECWGGFTWRAFRNWGPMVRLALPGLLMVEAECLSFEIITLGASYLGTTALAAQSILSTVCSLAFMLPFPLSIAGSTRVANLIGATLVDAARTSTKVSLTLAVLIGCLNMALLSGLRYYIPYVFTSEEDVIEVVAAILPICAAFQLFDALAANTNGILRGLGRQEIGGYVQVFCYYVVAMPISFGTAFGLDWGLPGLWAGPAVALFLVVIIESIFLSRTSWQRAVEEATRRNESA